MKQTGLSAHFRKHVCSEAKELRRLADLADSPTVRFSLLRQAELLENSIFMRPDRKTPRERYEAQRRVNPERDCIVTAIRKLGGLDTEIETDWVGRLSHLPKTGFGLPAIERPGKGWTLDDLAEVLMEYGYLLERNVWALEDKLSMAERGEKVFSLWAGDQVYEEQCGNRQVSDGDPWSVIYGHDTREFVPTAGVTLDDLLSLDREIISSMPAVVVPFRRLRHA